MSSVSKWWLRSFSRARSASSRSANCRAVSRMSCCSSVRSKSMAMTLAHRPHLDRPARRLADRRVELGGRLLDALVRPGAREAERARRGKRPQPVLHLEREPAAVSAVRAQRRAAAGLARAAIGERPRAVRQLEAEPEPA